MSFLRLAVRNVARPRAVFAAPAARLVRSRILQRASYSAAAGLDKEQITARVLEVLKGFEKVNQEKVSRSCICYVRLTNSGFPVSLPLLRRSRETSAWTALTLLKLSWP